MFENIAGSSPESWAGGRFRVADVSLGLMAAGQTETLEDRAMLDGDPYGSGGGMPGGGAHSG